MHEDTERCVRAVRSQDARFDGWFFTAVLTTRIYCRPSCPAVTPKPENMVFYRSSAAAQQAGFRACKRCRPDASPGSPEWNVRADLVGRAMRLIGDGVIDAGGVPGLAARLGYSVRQLERQLRAELGAGPLALARAQRAQTARLLIETTALPMGDVAFAAGFASIRTFNDTVREVFALSPSELRERAARRAGPGRRPASPPGVPPAGPSAAGTPAPGVLATGTPAAGTLAAGVPAPGVLATGTLAAGTSAPGVLATGTLAAGTSAPGVLATGTLAAGTSAPGVLATGTLAAGTSAPGVLATGTLAAGTSAPGVLATGTLAAGTSAPGILATGTLAAGTSAPGVLATGTLAAGTSAPGVLATGTLAAGTSAPGVLATGTLAAGTSAPGVLATGTLAAGTSAPGVLAAGTLALRLPFRAPLLPDSLFGHLAATAVPGVEEWRDGAYRRTLRLPHGPAVVALTPQPDHIGCRLTMTDLRDLATAISRCRRLLDLDADPVAVGDLLGADPVLAPLVAKAPGRRVPRTPDAAEFAVRAVLGQQVSTAAARTHAGRLAAAFGEPVEDPAGGLTRLFPDAATLAAAGPGSLAVPRSRRATFAALNEALAGGQLDLSAGGDWTEARRRLAALPGIGPWTVETIAMRALGDPDAFPATDLGVRAAARALGLPSAPAALAAAAAAWRPWRAYAVQYLWATGTHPINELPPAGEDSR